MMVIMMIIIITRYYYYRPNIQLFMYSKQQCVRSS